MDPGEQPKGGFMIWTISIVLLVLWILGIVSGYTLSGFIHVLLVIALVMILNRIIEGKNPLK
jgi:hypothetical protein